MGGRTTRYAVLPNSLCVASFLSSTLFYKVEGRRNLGQVLWCDWNCWRMCSTAMSHEHLLSLMFIASAPGTHAVCSAELSSAAQNKPAWLAASQKPRVLCSELLFAHLNLSSVLSEKSPMENLALCSIGKTPWYCLVPPWGAGGMLAQHKLWQGTGEEQEAAVARAGGAVLTVAWLFAGAVLVAGCFTFDQNFEPLVFSFSGQLPNTQEVCSPQLASFLLLSRVF